MSHQGLSTETHCIAFDHQLQPIIQGNQVCIWDKRSKTGEAYEITNEIEKIFGCKLTGKAQNFSSTLPSTSACSSNGNTVTPILSNAQEAASNIPSVPSAEFKDISSVNKNNQAKMVDKGTDANTFENCHTFDKYEWIKLLNNHPADTNIIQRLEKNNCIVKESYYDEDKKALYLKIDDLKKASELIDKSALIIAPHAASLLVEYIPLGVTSDNLKEFFSQYGDIKKAWIIYDAFGHKMDFGIVDFESICCAKNAIKECKRGCVHFNASTIPIIVKSYEVIYEKDHHYNEIENSGGACYIASVGSRDHELGLSFKNKIEAAEESKQEIIKEQNLLSLELCSIANNNKASEEQKLQSVASCTTVVTNDDNSSIPLESDDFINTCPDDTISENNADQINLSHEKDTDHHVLDADNNNIAAGDNYNADNGILLGVTNTSDNNVDP